MAIPKKFKKDLKLKIIDPQGGPKRWVDQFVEQNKTFLPRSVDHADMDAGFVEFINNELNLSINGEKVPVNFMTSQRWSEFTRNWKNSDKYNNIKIPFISIVRKMDVQPGTNPSDFKIPIRKPFEYMRVPTWDGIKKGMDIYKIPNPVGVDLTYTVRLFSFKIRPLNDFNRIVLQKFASRQTYINVKGHYFPILMESVGDESTMDDIEGKRYYVQQYEMKLQGYLVDENEFEVVPALERAFVSTELMSKKVKPILRVLKDDTTKEKTVKYVIQFLPTSPTELSFISDNNITFTTIDPSNLSYYTIKVNNVLVTTPFTIFPNDVILISIVKMDSTKTGEITLRGLINI
jgi:hypothetical protein